MYSLTLPMTNNLKSKCSKSMLWPFCIVSTRLSQMCQQTDLDEASDNENAEVEEIIKTRVRVGNKKMTKEENENY